MKKGIAISIIALFIVSAVSPMVIGLESDDIGSDVEREVLLDNLAFYCYGPNGLDIAKYEILKERLLKDYSNDEIDIVENKKQTIEPIPSISSSGPMDSPWPMQSHDTHHTGRSPYSTSHITGLEKWRIYIDGGLQDTPVIDNDGIIYFGGSYEGLSDYLYAVYPNGTLKWRFQADNWIRGSSPAIAEDSTIYVGCWDYRLYAINPNGTQKWRFNVKETIASSPTIADDGTIYFGTMGNKIYAINPNGTEKWHYTTGYKVTSDPAIGDDGTIYIGSGDTYFYAINPNGTLKWKFKTGDIIKGPASIADDGIVYIGSYDDYLYALYPNNGTVKWKLGGMGTEANPSIASDGTIYIGDENLFAVYPNGTLKWCFNLGPGRHIFKSSPAISADGTIYVGTNIGETSGGDIIAINPNGTEKWRKKIANDWVDSSPSIAEDGTVYIGSASSKEEDFNDWTDIGYLHAFGPIYSNEPPETPDIAGTINGKVGEEHGYKVSTIEPDLNPISFYVDWGDNTSTGWMSEAGSGETVILWHTWSEGGDYTIRAKARDTLGEESDWAYLEVTMPKNQNMQFGWLWRGFHCCRDY